MFSKMTPYKRKQIKEDLRDAAESTTGHVIPLIVKSRYWPMKLFYSLAWLTGFVFTILFITCGIMDYFKYDVTTKTRYVRESSMVFPKVTICNNDPFTTEASMKFLANLFRTDPEFSEDLERAVNNGVNVTSDIELANYILGLKRFDINMKLLEKAWQSDEATKKSLGYDRKTLILNCLFNVEVCTDNLTHTYDIRFGNCFTFNANKTFSSPEGGKLD